MFDSFAFILGNRRLSERDADAAMRRNARAIDVSPGGS
jgi:hypothetical protein